MGHHLTPEGKFQSDKYPDCPEGKVPLSITDPVAQPFLWNFADAWMISHPRQLDFAFDIKEALINAGYNPYPGAEHACRNCCHLAVVRMDSNLICLRCGDSQGVDK